MVVVVRTVEHVVYVRSLCSFVRHQLKDWRCVLLAFLLLLLHHDMSSLGLSSRGGKGHRVGVVAIVFTSVLRSQLISAVFSSVYYHSLIQSQEIHQLLLPTCAPTANRRPSQWQPSISLTSSLGFTVCLSACWLSSPSFSSSSYYSSLSFSEQVCRSGSIVLLRGKPVDSPPAKYTHTHTHTH